jgi:predicted enzyme related to lactoylglutathione lyase
MSQNKYGLVLFTGDHNRLAGFYAAVTGLVLSYTDSQIAVLESETFELVVHLIPNELVVASPAPAREDCYAKPSFPVRSLAETRAKASQHGGQLRPAGAEWESPQRGFRACEATDPDGNVIQFREPI